MHRLGRILLVASSLALPAGWAAAPAPLAAQAQPADSASAHRAATGFLAAFDSLQYDAFRGYFADDVTMFFPFPQVPGRADGREAVEAVFSRFFEGQRTSRTRAGRPLVQGIAPRDLRVQMAGADVAVVTFHLGSAETPARRSLVFRRTPGGEDWKVIHWHASSAPQAPTPAPAPTPTPAPPSQD